MEKEIENHIKEQLKVKEQPGRDKGWINTEDGISEILYGLIMALTYTCTISITKSDQTSVDDMLFGALCCNTAWGLIDAIMYLIMAKTDAVRANSILNFVRSSKKTDEACEYITDALPPVIASVLQQEEVEKIRERLSVLTVPASLNEQKWNKFKTAAGIFFLVFLSTFPVAIPFIFLMIWKQRCVFQTLPPSR